MSIKYRLYRNKRAGTPSIYCRVQQDQTMDFDRLCRKVSPVVQVHPGVVKAVIDAVLDEACDLVEQGYRVEIGEKRLSLYAQVRHSVRAEVGADGIVRWPDTEDIIPQGKDGRLECEVHKHWNRDFRSRAHWVRSK